MIETKNKYWIITWKVLLILVCLISAIVLSSCSQISFEIIGGNSSEVVSYGIDDYCISDLIVTPLPGHVEKGKAVTEKTDYQRSDDKDEADGTIKPTAESKEPINLSEKTPEEVATETGDQKKAPEPTYRPTVTPELQPTTTPLPKDTGDSLGKYVKLILQTIITEEMTNVDKVRAVHDYIILNTAYDIENLEADTLSASSFAVEGVLYYGKAVCQGYAETFQLFMEELGIESKFVEGRDLKNGISHAWNMVKLDGEWYHVDTTWDDPIPDQVGRAQYRYFLVTDQVLSVDHSWNKDKYPACKGEKYRYFIYEENIINSITEYEEKFIEKYDQGERTITILYPEEKLPDMSFLKNYDYLFKTVNKKRVIEYSWYPVWRLGDYTVLTVIME